LTEQSSTTPTFGLNKPASLNWSDKISAVSTFLLVASVWLSTILFGLYILAFFAVPIFQATLDSWNESLPGLYEEGKAASTAGIGAHFIAGGIILVLGCIQLMSAVRERFPVFHRWTGRVYVVACLTTALGGLLFVVFSGTIGGLIMDIGFGLYGVLMLLCAVMTIKFAMARKIENHRAWAVRLFSLAVGSWLYRMDYGFWYMLADLAGHTETFDGPFDYVMDFFFFIPNLLIAELFIRNQQPDLSTFFKVSSSVIMFISTLFIIVGTYAFTTLYWGPAIVALFI